MVPHARVYVETWAPSYGAPLENATDEVEIAVDPTVEAADWSPVAPRHTNPPERVAFVDGVRRVDARLTLDDQADGPVPGILGAFAVGAVIWDRSARQSTFKDLAVERLVVMARGRRVDLGLVAGFPVSAESTPGDARPALVGHLQARMRAAEQALATRMTENATLVVADGRVHGLDTGPVVGYTKTHHVRYLGDEHENTIRVLLPGERTPLFVIGDDHFARYAWYLRLASVVGGHA